MAQPFIDFSYFEKKGFEKSPPYKWKFTIFNIDFAIYKNNYCVHLVRIEC